MQINSRVYDGVESQLITAENSLSLAAKALRDSGLAELADKLIQAKHDAELCRYAISRDTIEVIQEEMPSDELRAAARSRLRPKMRELLKNVDTMSDASWGIWINGLPQDEFMEFLVLGIRQDNLASFLSIAEEPAHTTH
ncbi:alpha-E domain-containing protein [Pseudomonas aeruginosa]